MLRQADNKVTINGILSEIDLQESSYMKDGKTVENIRGTIKVKVSQQINDKTIDNEIPCQIFALKYKKDGNINPSYENWKKVKDDFISIAAAGGEQGADCVLVTGAKITENAFYNAKGSITSYPRIMASFIKKIGREELSPEATFDIQFVVGEKGYVVDRDGVETSKYFVKAAIPQFGEKIDIVELVSENPAVIDAVKNYWNKGDTVNAIGRLNFTSSTVTTSVEVGFGEAKTQTRTINTSELVITGGSQTPLEGEFAFDAADVKKAVDARAARIEATKERATSGAHSHAAPAQGTVDASNLGF